MSRRGGARDDESGLGGTRGGGGGAWAGLGFLSLFSRPEPAQIRRAVEATPAPAEEAFSPSAAAASLWLQPTLPARSLESAFPTRPSRGGSLHSRAGPGRWPRGGRSAGSSALGTARSTSSLFFSWSPGAGVRRAREAACPEVSLGDGGRSVGSSSERAVGLRAAGVRRAGTAGRPGQLHGGARRAARLRPAPKILLYGGWLYFSPGAWGEVSV